MVHFTLKGLPSISRVMGTITTKAIIRDKNCDIYEMLKSTGASITSIPVDHDGIDTSLINEAEKVKLVFTTPSHQFPIGGILPIDRRLKLISYVAKHSGYIIEDDYDSAFRYHGQPVSSIFSLNPARVIYVGTFSKILYPALRIGYVILPYELVDSFNRIKHLEDLHTPIMEQLTLAKFIQSGQLEGHINRCKKTYHRKRQHLVRCLQKVFSDEIEILGDQAGMHLAVSFKNTVFDDPMYTHILNKGLKLSPIKPHTQFPKLNQSRIMIGYGHLSFEAIESGVEKLRLAVN